MSENIKLQRGKEEKIKGTRGVGRSEVGPCL
jgi:hypothetical protein